MSTDQSDQRILIEIPATLRDLNILGACLTAMCDRIKPAPAATTVQAIELSIQEACTNIVDHAYKGITSGRIVMELIREGSSLLVHITDDGSSFEMASAPAPNLEEPHERGYGVFLMHQLMDRVESSRLDGRNHLRMWKRLDGGGASGGH